MISKIKTYISNGQTRKALDKLMFVSEKYSVKNGYNFACVKSNELISVTRDFQLGILSYNEKNIINNRINHAILSFCDELHLLIKKTLCMKQPN